MISKQERVELFGTTSGSLQLAIGSQWLPLNSYWKPPNLVRYWFPLISYWKPPNVFRKWFPLIDYWQPPTGFLYLSIGNHPRFPTNKQFLGILVQAACVHHPWWQTKRSWPLFSPTFFFLFLFSSTPSAFHPLWGISRS